MSFVHRQWRKPATVRWIDKLVLKSESKLLCRRNDQILNAVRANIKRYHAVICTVYNLCLQRKQYELKLAASDNLKENYTTVVIHVKDVNDNPPVFERPTYRTQITEEDDRNLPKRVLQVGLEMTAAEFDSLLNRFLHWYQAPIVQTRIEWGSQFPNWPF